MLKYFAFIVKGKVMGSMADFMADFKKAEHTAG